MQDVIEAVQVGAQHLIPVIVAERRKRAVAGQPGVEHHAVIGAVRLHVLFQNGLAGGPVRDIELQHACLTAQRNDFGLHRFGFAAAGAAMQDQVVSGLRQTQGDGAANATAGAGDQYRFSHAGAPSAR